MSVSNTEFFYHLNFEKVEIVVSSLTDLEENKRIIRQLKLHNQSSVAIVTAKNVRDSLELYNNDADYVIYPTSINEQQVSVLLEEYTQDINKVINKKIVEVTKLRQKEERLRESAKVWEIESLLGLK